MTTTPGQNRNSSPAGVAIIGMACLFPGARNIESFWSNIVGAVDAIDDVPPEQWDSARYFDPDSADFERVYCKKGGFITGLADFDPLEYGIMPNAVYGADPDQFLSMKVAIDAVRNAGYANKPLKKERAEVILGRTSAPGVGSLSLIQRGHNVDQVMDILAVEFPDFTSKQLADIAERLKSSLPPCNSDIIPGVMPNVLAGRIAGRLGFRGRSLILDAACASSLIAVEAGVKDLMSGECDLVLAGGIHVNSNAVFYQMFCGLGALSRRQRISPFGKDADGTMLGDGIGMVLLKRQEDAIADGDRTYAVIRGVGSSSDGLGTSVLAPSAEGEALALERAYEMSGISPSTVGLLEAHGTGTPAGDLAELQAIHKVFGTADGPWCALGSVKSMIGHTQAASGIAGLIKAALSLYHGILPATLNAEEPNPRIEWDKSPCYLNTRSRPWIHPTFEGDQEHPRRAAVSAFGFGGVNAHLVMEEAPAGCVQDESLLYDWETEICILQERSVDELTDKVQQLAQFLKEEPKTPLKDVAYTLCRQWHESRASKSQGLLVALVASSVPELLDKLTSFQNHLNNSAGQAVLGTSAESAGIYYNPRLPANPGKLAFLLPGLGAAYPNMLSQLCMHFPEVREVFDAVDMLAIRVGDTVLPSSRIFPRLAVQDNLNILGTASLAAMDSAVVTVLMVEWALYTLLKNLEVEPDALMGCSTGEFAAAVMGGSVDLYHAIEMFYRHSLNVARSIPKEQLLQLSSIRVDADYSRTAKVLDELGKSIYLTADLGPQHLVLSGTRQNVKLASAVLKEHGIQSHVLPIAIPYHTPLVEGVVDAEHKEIRDLPMTASKLKVWSCSTTKPFPGDVEEIRKITTELFTKPIRLRETIEAMYADGVRVFVEVGPKGGLIGLLKDTLGNMDHLAVATDVAHRGSITQLNHMLAALASNGVSINPDFLFKRRRPQLLDFGSSQRSRASKTSGKLTLTYPLMRLKESTHGLHPVGNAEVTEQQQRQLEVRADYVAEPQLVMAATAEAKVASVVSGYMSSLGDFHRQLMQVQEEVMSKYFTQAEYSGSGEADLAFPDVALPEQAYTQHLPGSFGAKVQETHMSSLNRAHQLTSRHPFLRTAQVSFAENSVSVSKNLTLQEDLYLKDHAIGGPVSVAGLEPQRVYLLPLMVALEIMAEAAHLLEPDLLPVRIENVRAHKRIRVDSGGFPLKVIARRQAASRIQVEMIDASQTNSHTGESQSLMSCEVVFAEHYPVPPIAKTQSLSGKRAAKIDRSRLYTPATMFHGPRLQSVVSLEDVGDRGIVGNVAVRPPNEWFSFDRQLEQTDSFLIDPLLLDNASQLVLYHLFEHDRPVAALLPFYIEAVEFFKSPESLSNLVKVQAQLVSITDRGTVAQVEVVDGDNHLWARISEICSRRIILPDNWSALIASPCEQELGRTLPEIATILSKQGDCVCIAVDHEQIPEDEGTLDWCADYVLAESEKEYWQTNLRADKRKRQWFMGRMAAKQAVRSLIKKNYNFELCPADVIVRNTESGAPVVSGEWLDKVSSQISVSIAHTDKVAVALACLSTDERSVGIDVEEIRSHDSAFEETSFNEFERAQFEFLHGEDRDLAVTQFWCAKEAVAKALRIGLADCLTRLQVEYLDKDAGRMSVVLLNGTGRDSRTRSLVVDSIANDRQVMAFAVSSS